MSVPDVWGLWVFYLANVLGAEYFRREDGNLTLFLSFNAEFSSFISFLPELILNFPSVRIPSEVTSGGSTS